MKNLKNVRRSLKCWANNMRILNKECKKNLLHDVNLTDLKEEKMNLSPREFTTRGILRQSLDEIYRKEEIYWKQHAKVTWLKERIEIWHTPQSGIKKKQPNQNMSLINSKRKIDSKVQIAKRFDDCFLDLFGKASESMIKIDWQSIVGKECLDLSNLV